MAVLAALLLLFAAPLMRGGNRQVALIALEAIALTFLLSLWLRFLFSSQHSVLAHAGLPHRIALAVLLSSPVWLALIYLVPVPSTLWFATAGRSVYQHLLGDAGITTGRWLPLSLVPDATRVSLLAGLPLVAGFLAGYLARLPQLKLLLSLVAAMAFGQILMGLLQIAGGPQSGLHFGMANDRPIGTFANPNHFANYIAMALAAYCWLGWDSLGRTRRRSAEYPTASFALRNAIALWVAGGLVLVLGVLISRSRGAALTGLPAAMLALALASSAGGRSHGRRQTFMLLGGLLAGAVALVGLDSVLSRFELSGMASAAVDRGLLGSTTMTGAHEFWPCGAGWGTYSAVYPRFQPLAITGFADYAHNDYAQMLFEGGIFALPLAAAFLWLAGSQAVHLARTALRHRRLNREEMASAMCGLGLLGLLAHSFLEFNMHIPANAILGTLLAGIYLRPLGLEEARH